MNSETALTRYFDDLSVLSDAERFGRLLGEEQILELCEGRQLLAPASLESSPGWSLLRFPSAVMHPGMLRTGTRILEALLQISASEVRGLLKGREATDKDRQYGIISDASDGRPKLELLTITEAYARHEAGAALRVGAEVLADALGRLDLDAAINQARNPDERELLAQFKAADCRPGWLTPRSWPCPPPQLRNASIVAELEQLIRRCTRFFRLREVQASPVIIANETFMLQEAVDGLYDATCAGLVER